MTIRDFEAGDYDAVRSLWEQADGVQLVDPDDPAGVDSREGIARFLARNPGLSFVAELGDTASDGIVGAIMTGTDGRRGFLHHLAVAAEHRNSGVGTALVEAAIAALSRWGIVKTHLFVVATNDTGAQFWSNRGWKRRDDLHMYSLNHRPNVADDRGMSYTER